MSQGLLNVQINDPHYFFNLIVCMIKMYCNDSTVKVITVIFSARSFISQTSYSFDGKIGFY